MSKQPFNYQVLRADFRAACAAHGVDPVEGATSYDLVRIHADTISAQREHSDWWLDPNLWSGALDDEQSLEAHVINRLFLSTYASSIEPATTQQPKSRRIRTQPCPNCGAGEQYQYVWRVKAGKTQYQCSKCDKLYTPNRGKPMFSDAFRARVLEMHKAGFSILAISIELDIDRRTVYDWLESFGVTRRKKVMHPASTRDEAKTLHAQGKTRSEIASVLNVHPVTVGRWLREDAQTPKRSSYPQEMHDRAYVLRQQKRTIAAIAQELGIHPVTVRSWLKKRETENGNKP